MIHDDLRVLYFLRDFGGCSYYRAELPLGACYQRKLFYPAKIEKGDDAGKIGDYMAAANVIVVPRLGEQIFLDGLLKMRQTTGARLVVDWDDDAFNVSPFSEAYRNFGVEEFSCNVKGTHKKIWEDGKTIDLKRTRATRETIKEACRQADMVTVTTEHLAKVYAPLNKNVRVLPNCVDMNRWRRLPLPASVDVRMGWFGGNSHFEDWLEIADILPPLMRKYPHLKLVIMGQKFEGSLKGVPADRIEFHEWEHVMAYPFKAAILNLDFAVIPLADTAFNRGKSPIKWIEMAALEVPAVTSAVVPYTDAMDRVEENGVFVENTPDTWAKGISLLAENAALRKIMGQNARETVRQFYDVNTQHERWLKAYKEVLDCPLPPVPHLTSL